ncbi:MAG: PQQ-binding-like beta-propeller repeat protein [Planctomycetota bacterium]
MKWRSLIQVVVGLVFLSTILLAEETPPTREKTAPLTGDKPSIYKDYCMPRGNPAGTGVVANPAWKGPKGPEIVEKWTLLLEKGDGSKNWPASIIVDEKFYISFGGNLHCVDTKTQKVLWQRAGRIGNPVIVADTLYIAQLKCLVAEEVESGKMVWQFEAPEYPCQRTGKSAPQVTPLVTEEYVFFSPSDSHLYTKQPPFYALDRKTGKVVWEFSYVNGFSSNPVFGLDMVYVALHATGPKGFEMAERVWKGQNDACLLALDSKTGKEKWRLKIGGTIIGLVLDQERKMLYGVGHRDRLVFVDALTGEKKAEVRPEQKGSRKRFNSDTVTLWKDYCLFAGYGEPLHGVDVDAQKDAWTFESNNKFGCYMAHCTADGLVYLGDEWHDPGTKMFAVEIDTGKEVWSFNPSCAVGRNPSDYRMLGCWPIVWKGVLYYVDTSCVLRAIGDKEAKAK